MEPEHIIDETATIQGADIEKVYDDCVGWLQLIKAIIREENKPSSIRAFHDYVDPLVSGSDIQWNWHPKDYPKYIVIKFNKTDSAVNLRFIIEKPKGFFTQASISKYRRWWILLFIGLLKHLNIDDDLTYSKKFVSKTNLEKMKRDILRGFSLPLLFSLIICASGIYLLIKDEVVGSIFLIGALFVPLRVFYEGYLLRKRLRILYPEKEIS